MRILLVHGWAFDPSVWEPLRAGLPAHHFEVLDLGYFGPARSEPPPGLDLVVGHSFGCLWAMTHPALAGIPLVAVNGFPRFTATEGYPHGTPARVLDRMLKRLREAPGEVLQAFHARLGTAVPSGEPDLDRLHDDLLRMRDQDARALPGQPVLACAAADDPIVPPELSRQAFPGRLMLLAEGGHVLPLTRPGAVARLIEAELGR